MKYPCVVRSKHIPPKPFFGISLAGFFIFRKDGRLTEVDVRHEHIHFLQQLEWLFVGFFVLYHVEYLWHLVRLLLKRPKGQRFGQVSMEAYRRISFEREAYRHEREVDYLKTRRHWANYRKNLT